jgi:hypothetical protein
MLCLAIVLALNFLSGCKTDKPIPISRVCILNGLGGADCVLHDGSRVYMAPSEMKNMWATPLVDMANFASWCYGTNATPALEKIQAAAINAH